MTYTEHYDAVLKAASKVYEAIDNANSCGVCVSVGLRKIYEVGGRVIYFPEVEIGLLSKYRGKMTDEEKERKFSVMKAMQNFADELTHAADFGYTFRVGRYRDGTTVVMQAKSTIEA